MRLRLTTVVLFIFVLTSGFVCTGSQLHNLRVANADLASALNHGAQEVISLNASGTITQIEERNALAKFGEVSKLSDNITTCINVGGASVDGCIRPILMQVQTDMSNLGIKSVAAQATVTAVTNAVNVVFDEFAKQGVTK